MCEQCEWGSPVILQIEELLEKYEDALACADDYTEQNLLSEIVDDLKTVLRHGE